MPQVPAYTGQQVSSKGLPAPTMNAVGEDNSGLIRGMQQLGGGVNEFAVKEKEKTDTAALLDADRKLNDWKTAAMFDPKTGVYTRKGQNALDITNQTLPGYDKHVEQVMGELGNEQQKARFKIVAASQREALSNELNRYEYGERQTWYDEADKASLEGAATSASLYYNRPDQMAGYMNKGLAVIESMGQRKGLPAEAVAQDKLKFTSGVHLNTIDRLMAENPTEALTRYAQTSSAMTAEDQAKVEKVLVPAMQKKQGAAVADALLSGNSADYQAYMPALFNQESGGEQFKNYGNRADGTPKGAGFLGELKRPDGKVSTEISVGIELDGKEVEIPTLVPTLDKGEIDYLLGGGDPAKNESIMDKAVAHAKQRMADGKSPFADQEPLTSSAGAVGVAQVMPATGPEAAKLAGVPWDEERFKTDKAYNACLGEAYCREQFRKFQDPVLALAAYNAGPGRVQQTIDKVGDPRTGDVTHEQFLAALPKETQGYVTNIISKTPQPKVSDPAEGAGRYAAALSAIQSMPAGPTRDAAEARIKDFKQADDARDAALYDQAAEKVKTGGFSSLSPEMQRSLSADSTGKLLTLDKKLREGTPSTTTPGKLDEFLTMDPTKLAGLSLERDIRPFLSDSDYTTVQSSWKAARKGDSSVQGVAKAENDNLKLSMSKAGIDVGTSKDALKPANLQKQDQYRAAYKSRRDSFVAANGRDPTVEEAQGLADMLLMDVKLKGGGTFFGDSSAKLWEVNPEDTDSMYIPGDMGVDSVPAADRAEIVRELRKNGLPASEETIVAAYQNKLRANQLVIK